MIKKYLFVFAAVLFMVSIATPALADQLWKSENNVPSTIEKWTNNIKGWLSEQDITMEEFESNLEKLFNPEELPPEEDIPEQREFEQLDKDEREVNEEEQSSPDSLDSQEPSEFEGKVVELVNEEEQSSPDSLDSQEPSEFEGKVVELVNEERAKEGLEPLEMYDRLSDLARLKSQDMADNDYFDHTSPTYGSPFDMMNQYDFSYWSAGENIAAGQRSPEQVVEGWMNSPGHRENIMKEDFTHIGVGYVEESGDRYGTYWTQHFMTPR
ncbi:CAP domain-containing protein [Halobacillus sp. A1]|uniref:CAP domain-containing protein n=1 Tax=Halobacillus sp. A1 TaxID=2880262 RepID=UPI00353234AD